MIAASRHAADVWRLPVLHMIALALALALAHASRRRLGRHTTAMHASCCLLVLYYKLKFPGSQCLYSVVRQLLITTFDATVTMSV